MTKTKIHSGIDPPHSLPILEKSPPCSPESDTGESWGHCLKQWGAALFGVVGPGVLAGDLRHDRQRLLKFHVEIGSPSQVNR